MFCFSAVSLGCVYNTEIKTSKQGYTQTEPASMQLAWDGDQHVNFNLIWRQVPGLFLAVPGKPFWISRELRKRRGKHDAELPLNQSVVVVVCLFVCLFCKTMETKLTRDQRFCGCGGF